MPGRYADELRRITRAQGGTPSDGGPPGDGDEARHEGPRRRPIFAFFVVLALVGGGWLVLRQLMADSKLQDCVMSGRKNCAPVEIDSAGR